MMTRDEKGRFVPGNPGGGRKPRAIEERYLEIFKETVSTADWIAIIKRAVQDAIRGDGTARKFVADYLIGTPIERREVTGRDGGPLEITEVAYDLAKEAHE